MRANTTNLDPVRSAPDFGDFSKKWLALLAATSLGGKADDRRVGPRNSVSQYQRRAIRDRCLEIVLHVVNHATYHRGQITTMLRQLGRKPIGTDLIIYYRSL